QVPVVLELPLAGDGDVVGVARDDDRLALETLEGLRHRVEGVTALPVAGRRPRGEDDLVLELDGHLALELGELDLSALDLIVERAGKLLVLLALRLELALLLG